MEDFDKLPSDKVIYTIIASLLHQAYDLGLSDLEGICRKALIGGSDIAAGVLSQHEIYTQTNKSASDASTQWKAPTGANRRANSNMDTNHALRFAIGATSSAAAASEMRIKASSSKIAQSQSFERVVPETSRARRASMFERVTGGIFAGNGSTDDAQAGDYEEVTSSVILNAPITEICVLQKNDSPPTGYYRVSKTPTGKRANVNTGSGGSPMYFCIKKDVGRDTMPITTLMPIFADRGEFLPPGYSLVRRNQYPCNFNLGTSGERVFLAYRRDRTGNPLTDMQVILPGSSETTPPGFILLDKSASGLSANLNSGTGGSRVYICYKQMRRTLRCLECGGDEEFSNMKNGGGLPASPASASSSEQRNFTTSSSDIHDRSSPPATTRDRTSTMDMQNALSPVTVSGNRIRTSTMDSVNSNVSDDAANSTYASSAGNSAHIDQDVILAHNNGSAGENQLPLSTEEAGDGVIDEGVEEADEEEDLDIETADYVRRTSKAMSRDDLLLDVDSEITQPVTNALGVLRSPGICRAMYCILAALQVRYSAVAQTSIQGLMLLLKETDMFSCDVHVAPNGRALTMLHMTVGAICERLELHLEAETRYLLFFLLSVVKQSSGEIHHANIQRIFRSLAFIMQYQASKVDWSSEGTLQAIPNSQQNVSSMSSLFGDMPPDLSALSAGTQVMRCLFRPVEMLSNTQTDLHQLLHYLPTEEHEIGYFQIIDNETESNAVAREIVLELVNAVLDAVEMARITEVSQKIVSRTGLPISNNAYWSQMHVITKRLFVEPHIQSCYMVLCWALKLAWAPVRFTEDGEPLQREVYLKLMSLQGLQYYLNASGELIRSSEIMGFQVRRLVVPCILANVSIALLDHRIFTKLMGLISLLWKNWRVHVHLEFAILVEQLIIPVMQATSRKHTQPIFQTIVLQEVSTWFDQPALLVEMFVNFDMDRSSMNHWNVFSHLVRTICGTARKIVEASSDQQDALLSEAPSASLGYEDAVSRSVTSKGVHIQALEEACRIAKALMDAAGHAYLIVQDAALRSRSVAVGAGWEENDKNESSGDDDEEADSESGRDSPRAYDNDSPAVEGRSRVESFAGNIKRASKKKLGVRFQRAVHQEKEELLTQAIAIYHKEDKSLVKAVRYLTEKNFMEDTPQDIAQFLRVYRSHFDPSSIGDFLGEGGKTPREIEYWAQIRFRYTRALSWIDMDVEPALRLYLTGSGFRLPGEAQKVNRFVEVFVKTFWQDNSGTERCPFRHPDTVHLLTYAIIMLNTDHHRANVEKKHAARKMTAEGFIKNLRGVDMNHDIDPTYLAGVFEAVHSNAIELAFDDDGTSRRPDTRKSVLGSIAFAFAPPTARGAAKESNGLDADDEASISISRTKFRKDIEKNLRGSRDLMQSLSYYVYHFSRTGVDTNISLDLVTFMYETVWYHFRMVGSALLVEPNKDMFVTFHAMDILCYTLTTAIFLDMHSQKMTLADQLLKFQTTYCSHIDIDWYNDVRDCQVESSDYMDVISNRHKVLVIIKDSCQEKANRDLTVAAANKIEKKANILQYNAYFVRQGDVEKQNRKGGYNAYRLFLFSDQLIYASNSGIFQGEYKVHGQQSLSAMSVSDIDTDPTQCTLYIEHPYKSFVIRFESPSMKSEWLRDIHQTINNCIRRGALDAQKAAATAEGAVAPAKAVSPKVSNTKTSRAHPVKRVGSSAPSQERTRTTSLSIDLAEELEPRLQRSSSSGSTSGTVGRTPRRMSSGANLISSPLPEMDHRMEAQIASQSAFLLSALNNNADRPQRLSLTREDLLEIKKLNFGGDAGKIGTSGSTSVGKRMVAYNEKVLSSQDSPDALSSNHTHGTFTTESTDDDDESALSSDDGNGDFIGEIWSACRSATMRDNVDLSKDENYAAL